MRCTLIVLDSLGVGAMPDAAEWGDAGADTFGHIAEAVGELKLPHLEALGLGNIRAVPGCGPVKKPGAGFGRAAIVSAGKDTISGHWDMAGVPVKEPFHTYPKFPAELMDAFHQMIGRESLGNYAVSGTVVIEDLGPEHLATGKPIVYTSSDSVFQIAAHEDIVDVDTLYDWCEDAFRLVTNWGVARVIARPFVGEPGSFTRTHNRRDFSLRPPAKTVVDMLKAAGQTTTSVGKVKSVFGDRGFTKQIKAGDNAGIMRGVLDALDHQYKGLIFANFVDFDMLFGHRRDPEGYAKALVEFDHRIPDIMERMGRRDLLILTADHGNDPTAPGSDHTREYVPILAWQRDHRGNDLGTRTSLADVAATIADWFELKQKPTAGTSFLRQL